MAEADTLQGLDKNWYWIKGPCNLHDLSESCPST